MENSALNEHQAAAAQYDDGHVLVLAGAGTGKTRTIIARAAHLMQQGVQPWRILLLTFTRRAAKEMGSRLEQMSGPDSRQVTAGTFHHFCLYTMRRMGDLFGMATASVIDREDQVQLMKLARSTHVKKGQRFPRAAELVNLNSYARNTAQPLETYLSKFTDHNAETSQAIIQITNDYDQRKKENNYLDYDDILYHFAASLQASEEIQQRVKSRYDHILVDEMQDTNPLQWMILDGLRDPARLFCVGDDAQSIYAFRGADFQNVHRFAERVPGAVVLRLERNYRSLQGILDLSNWLLARSPLKYGKQLTADRKAVVQPRLIDFDTEFDEARWIVNDLCERHENGADWRAHMIITRTGNGARAVESYMVEKKVPYRFVGGTSLMHAAHVKDLFSLIRAAGSHRDELAWIRYLTLWPRIGDVTAGRLIGQMQTVEKTDEALALLEKKLKNREFIAQNVSHVINHWADPGLALEEAGNILAPVMERRYANWNKRKKDFKLLEKLARNHRSLLAFLETYTLDPISTSDAERLEGEDVVTLTTAHSAKGTEACTCYLIRVEPGMYPHIRSLGNQDAEEEERRILYVAMTRARDELIITRSRRAQGYFTTSYSQAAHSPGGTDYFLDDIDEALVDMADLQILPDAFSRYSDF